jgi:hypothetical protein
VGIIFCSGDDTLTAGAEDCYAALLDISNDKLIVRRYVNGTPTEITTGGAGISFVSAIDTWYTVGVIIKKGATYQTIKVYAKATASLTEDDDVFDEANLLDTITDATYTNGHFGVMSISTLGRFDEVNFVSLKDKVIPADTITVEAKAIYRTIAPFCE